MAGIAGSVVVTRHPLILGVIHQLGQWLGAGQRDQVLELPHDLASDQGRMRVLGNDDGIVLLGVEPNHAVE